MHLSNDRNYADLISDIQNVLNLQSMSGLSVSGRIKIFKIMSYFYGACTWQNYAIIVLFKANSVEIKWSHNKTYHTNRRLQKRWLKNADIYVK